MNDLEKDKLKLLLDIVADRASTCTIDDMFVHDDIIVSKRIHGCRD